MQSRILELSKIIAENTEVVDEYFARNEKPTPSFDIDGPRAISIPAKEKEVSVAHTAVLDATRELNLLMTGPVGVIMGMSPNDCLSLHAIYHYRVAQALPVGEEHSFEELSAVTGLNVTDLSRLLRHAMCNFIFCEPRPGYVGHTAASKLLAETPLVDDIAGITTEEKFPGAVKVVDALEKNDGATSQNPADSGFSLGHNTDKGLYDEIASYPERNKRWVGAMNAFSSLLSLDGLINGFDWKSFGKATVVDVGGGFGLVSVGIAANFPDLNFIIEDLPEVVADGTKNIPRKMRDRFKFVPYNFIQDTQSVKDGDIYFFRAIFSNWSDEYCLRIFRNQIPALKAGARLLINDSCLHEPKSLPLSIEKRRRSMDLNMLTYFGSHERTPEDWKALLHKADTRFNLRNVTKPPNDLNHILDVEWRG